MVPSSVDGKYMVRFVVHHRSNQHHLGTDFCERVLYAPKSLLFLDVTFDAIRTLTNEILMKLDSNQNEVWYFRFEDR